MKTLKILFILFILTGVASCKKLQYETINIKATMFDLVAQQYLSNIKVSLKERVQDRQLIQGAPNYTYRILKEAYTDINGEVDFGKVELRKNRHYDYYLYTLYSEDPISKGKNNNIQIEVYGYVHINVIFTPPPPYNTGDSLSLKLTSFAGGLPSKITNNNYYNINLNVGRAPGYHFIDIDKYKSGLYTNTKDTVFYTAFGTYDYIVNW